MGSLRSHEKGSYYFDFHVSGHKVCEKALCKIFGPSQYKLNRAKQLCTDDEVENSKSKEMPATNKWGIDWHEEFQYFLNIYTKELGDVMPHKEEVHMPVYLTPEDLYNEFVLEMKATHPQLEDDVCKIFL